ncbi:MAG TPA: hypothetical protein VG826_25955 [Pirellulales bacterium]|nr:hypothetical protein [Pirellulales bacterium]
MAGIGRPAGDDELILALPAGEAAREAAERPATQANVARGARLRLLTHPAAATVERPSVERP